MTILISAPVENTDYAVLWSSESSEIGLAALDQFAEMLGFRLDECDIRVFAPFWGAGGNELYHYRLAEQLRGEVIQAGAVETDLRTWMIEENRREKYPLIDQALKAGIAIERIGHFWGDGDFNYDFHIDGKFVDNKTNGTQRELVRELLTALQDDALEWQEGEIQCEDEDDDYCEPDLKLIGFR